MVLGYLQVIFWHEKPNKTYEKTDTRQNIIVSNIANMASNYYFIIQKYAY